MMKSAQKLYYSIGEVSEIVKVKPHVLRYWETQFPVLKPKKNRAGNRTYRVRDMRLLLTIKSLLYERGFTISGARKKLREYSNDANVAAEQMSIPFTDPDKRRILVALKHDLLDLRALVESL